MITGVSAATARRALTNGSATESAPGLSARQLAGRLATCGVIAGLVLFHAQLLWQRISSVTLLEPLVALRWSAAALMVVAFVYLQRSGISVVWGHKALILWLLVLVLHAGLMPVEAGALQPAEPVLLAISLLGLALSTIHVARPTLAAAPRSGRRPFDDPGGLSAEPGFFAPLSPRPPPARSAG